MAELVKVEHGHLGSQKVGLATVTVNKTRHQFDIEEVQMIIEARVEELFEYVDKELKKIHRSQKLPGGVVLVGGTAKLPGIAAYAKEKMQLAARVGKLQQLAGLIDTVQDPEYSSAVGLMLLDMLLEPLGHHHEAGKPNTSVAGMVEGVLKRFKKQ